MRNAGILVLCTAAVCGCGAPMGPIPGGKLDGPSARWPDTWTFTEEIENVLLETRPSDPYSVTIWGVTYNQNFYVAAASDRSRWVLNIRENSDVVLSVSGTLYPAVAAVVNDSRETTGVLNAYVNKYDIEGDEDSFIADGGVLFRLMPR